MESIQKHLEYYYQALDRNPALPQALNNIAVIYHYRGEQALEAGNIPDSETLFGKAAEYWKEAIRLAPLNYSEAQNWLQTTWSLNTNGILFVYVVKTMYIYFALSLSGGMVDTLALGASALCVEVRVLSKAS